MSHLPPDVAQAAGIRFVCPRCRGPLSFEEGDARCENCQASYPSQEGIRYFFLDSAASGVTGLANYTENFFSVETAATYAHSFETVPRKRWRTKRELAVLDRLLGGDPGQCVLNIPCGSGRLSAPLRKARRLLIEADSSPGQLALNRRRVGNDPAVVLITASAFHLPLPDAAVDTVVCARLSHHLSDAAARERLFGELMRVSSHRVVFSFRHRASVTSLSRQLRGRPVHAAAMSATDIERLASRHDARVERVASVSNLGARHGYALVVRNG